MRSGNVHARAPRAEYLEPPEQRRGGGRLFHAGTQLLQAAGEPGRAARYPILSIAAQGGMMIIGYVATDFPVMTETFIRREAAAIAASGHTVIVFADRVWPASEFTELGCPTLSIREVPFVSDASALTAAAREAGVEHLHGCLTTASHKAAHLAASRLRIPFTIRVYSGYDIFTSRDTALYRGIADSEWCGG